MRLPTYMDIGSTSCLAAIYFQDATAIQHRCKVATETAEFTLERLNKMSFVSVAQTRTTAQIQYGNRRSVHQLQGMQIGTLRHSCSITAGHSAMASSRQRPGDMTFQIRAIPDSLTESLRDWGPNKQLAEMIDSIGAQDHIADLTARVRNLSLTAVHQQDLQQSTTTAILTAVLPVPVSYTHLTLPTIYSV